MSVGEAEMVKVVGEYRITAVGDTVTVSVFGGGEVASKELSNEKQACKLVQSLTNRDKVERFVRENSW
jgi:hypothetical protein